MDPDLPNADGVPDSSEAAFLQPRFALTTTRSRTHPRLRAIAALGLAAVLSAGTPVLMPTARADGLNDQRHKVTRQLHQAQDDLDDSSAGLGKAVGALAAAQASLDRAQAALARTRSDLTAATTADHRAAAKLAEQQQALAAAQAAVARGVAELAAQRHLVARMVSEQYQKQTNLMPFALLAQSSSLGDLQSRVQVSTTMLDSSQTEFDRLRALQQKLEADEGRQSDLEHQVAADRAAAAQVLTTKTRLERQAADQAGEVGALVRHRQSAKDAAARAVAADKRHYAQLQDENAALGRRIAARIAAQKAAARAAAARAEAERAAARHRAAASVGGSGSGGGARGNEGVAAPGNAHHGFIYPVNGPITSSYGMRLHPILHVWKLHDGTDFGAACGTPIHAAYAGTVEERYFNAGYGNRLIIDHGRVDGRYVSTAYNHATRYVVHVGQHVREGQLIGYVGQTGYATGCHLHLMVYLDGQMVNPMSWY